MRNTEDSPAFDNTVVDLASRGRPRRFSVGTVAPETAELTVSELTVLGMLALNAADNARADGNEAMARLFVKLALKCDVLADDK
jgi:hypothetical protein